MHSAVVGLRKSEVAAGKRNLASNAIWLTTS
jgi:hypothetical protein